MVRAAEITGNLNEVAGFLADYAEKESILASKAASAMIYPAVVLSLFAVVGFIMITFVFPQIGPVFEQGGVKLPWYTATLLGTGKFMSKWWPAVVLGFIGLGIVGLNYARTEEGTALVDDAKIKLPILKKVFIPIAQALEVISHMVGNVLYQDVIHEVAEDVRQGGLMSQSLEKHPDFFPPLVSQMIAIGETTGKIEQIFQRIGSMYGREADETVNNLVDLIQPLLMIVMGVGVGLLFASILVPLYNLTTNIH
jgi:type IV pilus assembly protein PilC